MAVSSSRMFPSDEDSTSRILSSISFNCLCGTMERERGLVALCIHVQHRERLRLRQKWIDCVVIILHSLQKKKACVNCTCSFNSKLRISTLYAGLIYMYVLVLVCTTFDRYSTECIYTCICIYIYIRSHTRRKWFVKELHTYIYIYTYTYFLFLADCTMSWFFSSSSSGLSLATTIPSS